VIDQSQIEDVRGSDAYSRDGEKIGTVVQLYSRNAACEPAWATVHTGLFGVNASFVPLSNASFDEGRLMVAYDKDTVLGAPRVASVVRLSLGEEQVLYAYYGLEHPAGSDSDDSTGEVSDLDQRRKLRSR
jgi:PRC-barrel domain